MSEHIKQLNGEIQGVYHVDTDNISGSLWEMIDKVIESYSKINPEEIKAYVAQNQKIKNSRLTAFASSKENTLRFGASLPVALMFKLEKIEPELFTDKKLFNQFIKRYKGFTICKII